MFMSYICKKCGVSFPCWVIIEGKSHNLNNRKFCLSCSPFGRHNTRDITKYANNPLEVKESGNSNTQMIKCKHHGLTEFIYEERGYHRCKKCRSISVTNHRRKIKALLVKDFGGKCVICGYNKCQQALQFHHTDPKNKDFNISSKGTKSYKKVLEEARKCILICSNCHFEIHNNII